MPFLWELAVTEAVATRPEVIELLQTVLEQGNGAQAEIQLAAHQAVLSGRSTIDLLTQDDSPAVRATAGHLLTALDIHRCETCHPL
ncbi:hypothetical protein ACFRQM_45955 [Streptomyces sp. NPDC056831]|uniref:hypothetical protein n=1 Tax=Streptomyces sp. NPDC056831 TaxID=3345954 RepID=UPI00369C3A4B